MTDLVLDADHPDRQDFTDWRTVLDYMVGDCTIEEWIERFSDVEPAEIIEHINTMPTKLRRVK